MSVNRREEVLARIFEILGGLAGFETKFRNRGKLTNDKHPSVGMLDGDETTKTQARPGRPGMSTVIVTMSPQIFIILKDGGPTNKDVGTELNSRRGDVLRAIAADAQLKALIGPNGAIRYDGAETDLKTGMSLSGEMQINLSIDVPLNPNA